MPLQQMATTMGMLERTTIFLGAFLLFLLQPMVGSTLLPVFGGTATVWSVCLASFQTLLVGGYLYAHLLRRGANGTSANQTRRLCAHCAILLLSAGWLCLAGLNRGRILAATEAMPSSLGVSAAVLLMVAIPYVVLSANSTLVQDISGGNYALYAFSNLGSLVGLWAYPLAFERWLGLTRQWMFFTGLCLAYAALFATLAFARRKAGKSARLREFPLPTNLAGASFHPTRPFALSALSCFLLNAVSTHLGSDVTPLPLLWVGLLSLYLLSYVIGFTGRFMCFTPWAGRLFIPLALFAVWHMGLAEFKHFKMELATGASVLFLGGCIIHARLYAIRPDPRHLTLYYLMVALGGAFGGAVCSFAMPVATDRVVEYPVAIALTVFVSLAVAYAKIDLVPKGMGPNWIIRNRNFICGAAFACAIGTMGVTRVGSADGDVLRRYRNFYGSGVVAHRTITTSSGDSYGANEFRCNGTTHGFQITTDSWAKDTPTVYYARHAGGLPFLNHHKAKAGEPMRVALCGMGIGTLAAYATDGDFYRFYEINPSVAEIAQDKTLFSFLSDSKGVVEVVVDDARRALANERAKGEPTYDILVVDVFTGDAIPPHMATREAFALYLDRLAPGGVLAFHLSNWHLDLMPIIKAAATSFDLKKEAYYCSATPYAFESTWAFLSREDLPAMFDVRCHSKVDFDLVPNVALMTDEHHSLLPYIQWNLN